MASSAQSPFTLYVTLASVALSLVAFTTVASNGESISSASKRSRRKKASQPKSQPQPQTTVDELRVETTKAAQSLALPAGEIVDESVQNSNVLVKPEEELPDLDIEPALDSTVQDHEEQTASLISQTAKISRSLRARNFRDVEQTVKAELQTELSQITGTLCRLQQELITNPDLTSCKDEFENIFQSSFQAVKATFSTLETAFKDERPTSSVLDSVRKQLQDQRPLLESLFNPNDVEKLPPTPPSDTLPDTSPSQQNTVDVTPQPSPRISFDTGVTPSASRVEPPPEFLPPAATSVVEQQLETPDADLPEVVDLTSSEKEELPTNTDALYAAVTENDSDSLSQLLSKGLDPMAQFGELQRTALHQAAHLNRVDCLQTLLQHGAVMKTEDAKGDTALHLASWVGNVEAISVLLEHGADVDWLSGRDGYSPLWCAVSAHQIKAARLLLRHGAQVSLPASTGGSLMPLHQAAVTGQGAMCELLLDHGAHVNCLDDDRSTPLHYAAVSGSGPSITVLLRQGADIEARQVHGLTAVHWAAHKGHVDALAVLLDYGARLDPLAGDGATPLHLAASRGHTAAAQLLVDRGSKKRSAHASWAGVAGTPADMARAKGHANLARILQA